jgi:HSP20 family protein
MSDKDLQLQEKQELQTGAESTRNVPVFVPPVDIYETEKDLTLLADMPGVTIENVDIDLSDSKLTIRGACAGGEEIGSSLLREFRRGDYYRQFSLSNTIDQGKIEASMKNGVLKVVLPKAEASRPRKIDVRSA